MNVKEDFVFEGKYERPSPENSKGQIEHLHTYTNICIGTQKSRKRAGWEEFI